MEAWLAAAVEGSFPVVVAGFLLFRIEGALQHLTEAIEGLRWCRVCRYGPKEEGAAA